MKALKIGCLSCLLLFALLIVAYFSGTFYLMSSDETNSIKPTPFEVVTKKGLVKLHLGMPKDSVILLIGKPDNYNSHSVGSTVVEEVGYVIKSKNCEDLSFHFENGVLESFRQD